MPEQPILEYRREQLLQCGFPFDWAHALALDRTVDIHDARDLAARAGHHLAWLILMPLEDREASKELDQRQDYMDRIRMYT